MGTHHFFPYLSELLNLLYVIAVVPVLFYYLRRLTKRELTHKWLILVIYIAIFYSYFDIVQNISRDGDHQEYYENGVLKNQGAFINGGREGVHRFYREDGTLGAEWSFRNNKAHGLAKAYYPTGELKVLAPYKNGKREGVAKIFYPTGELLVESFFKNDILINRKTYDEDGILVKEENF